MKKLVCRFIITCALTGVFVTGAFAEHAPEDHAVRVSPVSFNDSDIKQSIDFVQKGEDLVIAFRGTKELADLISHAHVMNGKLKHSRFVNENGDDQLNEIKHISKSYQERLTHKYLKALAKGAKNVKIIGQGAGGSLAQLTAHHLSNLAATKEYEVEIKVVDSTGKNQVEQKTSGSKVREGLASFAEGLKGAEKTAKATFVSGFQAFRRGVAGLFGY